MSDIPINILRRNTNQDEFPGWDFAVGDERRGFDSQLPTQEMAQHVNASQVQNLNGKLILFSENVTQEIEQHIDYGYTTGRNRPEQGGALLGYECYRNGQPCFIVTDFIVASEGEQNASTGAIEFTHNDWRNFGDILNRQNNERTIPQDKRTIGWLHTHPGHEFTTPSGTDMGTQRDFFSEKGFMVIIDPQNKMKLAHWAVDPTEDRRALDAIMIDNYDTENITLYDRSNQGKGEPVARIEQHIIPTLLPNPASPQRPRPQTHRNPRQIQTSNAHDILSQVHSPNIHRVLKKGMASTHDSENSDIYILPTINARNDGRIEPEQLEYYHQLIYLRWYNHILSMSMALDDATGYLDKHSNDTSISPKERLTKRHIYIQLLKDIRDNPEYHPNNIESLEVPSPFTHFLKNECTEDKLGDLAPYSSTGRNGFGVHKLPNEQQEDTELNIALTLNISSKNIVAVGVLLMERCDQQGIPLNFQSSIDTKESDVIMIHTTYEHAQAIIDVLTELRTLHPEQFHGAENTSVGQGQIAGFIGFAETPSNNSHYYEHRDEIVQNLKNTYTLLNAKNVTTPSFTLPDFMQDRNGNTKSLLQYLVEKLTTTVKQTPKYRNERLNINFTNQENKKEMQNLALHVLRSIVNGTENQNTDCKLVDTRGNLQEFPNLAPYLTQSLINLTKSNNNNDPLINRDEMLKQLFSDENGGGYNEYCHQQLTSETIAQFQGRIRTARTDMCEGTIVNGQRKMIPVSQYNEMVHDLNVGTPQIKRIINRAVYNHLIDLHEGKIQMNAHQRDPNNPAPSSIANQASVTFPIHSGIPNVTTQRGFAINMLSVYMQRQNITPTELSEDIIRAQCEPFDISYDNFAMNDSTWQQYISHQQNQNQDID